MDVGKPIRRAAVFGASGGIGRALVEALIEQGAEVWAGSRSGDAGIAGTQPFAFDLGDETSIAEAADAMSKAPPDLVIVASGALTLDDGTGPERSYRSLDPDAMARVFLLNTIGPAIVGKHMLPLFDRKERCVFAALSARVGSISDNRLGGWHSYRASKAALNMLLKSFAIELARTHKQAVVAGLHPGTVDTRLSEPFQSNLPDGQLAAPGDAAAKLLEVIAKFEPSDSGKVFDYAGEVIPA